MLFKPVDEFTDEDFDHMVAVDLKAAFVASRAAVKHMSDGGRIVFISSNIADLAALPTTSVYSMVHSNCMITAQLQPLCVATGADATGISMEFQISRSA